MGNGIHVVCRPGSGHHPDGTASIVFPRHHQGALQGKRFGGIPMPESKGFVVCEDVHCGCGFGGLEVT